MNNKKFLQRIFNGYVTCYRKNNWHISSNYYDMTHTELNFFLELGERLGFIVRKEMNWHYPRDLAWCETSESEAFLYLERENENSRCLETIEKMLKPDNSEHIENLVAVFGYLEPITLISAKNIIRQQLPKYKNFLLISWVGESKDEENYKIEGWVFYNNQESTRLAIAKRDDADYWYMYFPKANVWF